MESNRATEAESLRKLYSALAELLEWHHWSADALKERCDEEIDNYTEEM